MITGGQQTSQSAGKRHVPKHDLITNLEALFRDRHLALDRTLPHLDYLIKASQAPHGTEQFSGKASGNDELVLALSLAADAPLRSSITSPPSGCERDFHLRAVEHARHTKQMAAEGFSAAIGVPN